MASPYNYYREFYKKRTDWLNSRGIGGSDLAALFNESKWKTPDDLYDELALGKKSVIKANETMIKGTLAEANIRNLFALDYADDFKVTNPPLKGFWIYRRKDKKYMTVTPDGLLKNLHDGSRGGLEIKYVSLIKRSDKDIWENNSLPDQYYWQLIQYMAVIGKLDYVYLFAHLKYFVFDEANQKQVFDHSVDRSYLLNRKDCLADIARAEEKQTEFWEDNVLKRKRPDMVIKF